MAAAENLTLVFVAGLVTAIATGVGALPFFFEGICDRRNVVLWGLASGIMVSASVFGLVEEGLVWWAIFSSLPQPIGAVLAFGFVRYAREVLPYGFAAGAMIYLVSRSSSRRRSTSATTSPGAGSRN